MFYTIKTNWIFRSLYKYRIWHMPRHGKKIYLTFDDGPHPEITAFVLDELLKYKAKATFFCIGKNVEAYPQMYKRILMEGHATGNHTYNHLNGWKVEEKEYFDNIAKAKEVIDSNLFRPPYGRISNFAAKHLKENAGFNVIMWSILSGDFDVELSPEGCLKNVIKNTQEGDIVVFHDSEKAFKRMRYALPKVLQYFSQRGYTFEKISLSNTLN